MTLNCISVFNPSKWMCLCPLFMKIFYLFSKYFKTTPNLNFLIMTCSQKKIHIITQIISFAGTFTCNYSVYFHFIQELLVRFQVCVSISGTSRLSELSVQIKRDLRRTEGDRQPVNNVTWINPASVSDAHRKCWEVTTSMQKTCTATLSFTQI